MEPTGGWFVTTSATTSGYAKRPSTWKALEGYGQRMQYSVFRCWLSRTQTEQLRWELTELLASEDDVLMIPLCSRCVDGIQGTHTAVKQPDWPEEPDRHKIV